MHRQSTATIKKVADTEPGELFLFSLGGTGALGVMIKNENGRQVVGSLSDTPKPRLAWLQSEFSGHCLSYGKDWLLEEIHDDETFPSNSYNHYASGKRLFLSPEGLYLAFGPLTDNDFYPIYFNLSTSLDDKEIPERSIPVANWRIWECAKSRDDQRSKPVYEFKYTKNPDT